MSSALLLLASGGIGGFVGGLSMAYCRVQYWKRFAHDEEERANREERYAKWAGRKVLRVERCSWSSIDSFTHGRVVEVPE